MYNCLILWLYHNVYILARKQFFIKYCNNCDMLVAKHLFQWSCFKMRLIRQNNYSGEQTISLHSSFATHINTLHTGKSTSHFFLIYAKQLLNCSVFNIEIANGSVLIARHIRAWNRYFEFIVLVAPWLIANYFRIRCCYGQLPHFWFFNLQRHRIPHSPRTNSNLRNTSTQRH